MASQLIIIYWTPANLITPYVLTTLDLPLSKLSFLLLL